MGLEVFDHYECDGQMEIENIVPVRTLTHLFEFEGGIKMFSSMEIEIIEELNHPLYTVEFLKEWVGRNDNVVVNAPAALQAMGANGYYEAIRRIAEIRQEKEDKDAIEEIFKEN